MIQILSLFSYISSSESLEASFYNCPDFFVDACDDWCFLLKNYTLNYTKRVYNSEKYYSILNAINYSVGFAIAMIAVLKIRRIIINATVNEAKLEKLRQRRISAQLINIAKEIRNDVTGRHLHELPDSMRDMDEIGEKDYISLIEKGGDLEKYADHFTKQWKQDISDTRSAKFKKMKVKLLNPTDAAFAQSADERNIQLKSVFYEPAKNVEIEYDMDFDPAEDSCVSTEKTGGRTIKSKRGSK